MTLSYLGTPYVGWQRQPKDLSVQQVVEEVLERILEKETKIVGSSRTDTGVHALGQVAHFDSYIDLEPKSFLRRLNGLLPSEISGTELRSVRSKAHARHDAILRQYLYRIHFKKQPLLKGRSYYCPYYLDVEAMNKAARLCLLHSDFQSFASRSGAQSHYLCQLRQAFWHKEGEELLFSVTANRFLRTMVRTMVGTYVEIGRGSLANISDKRHLTPKEPKQSWPKCAILWSLPRICSLSNIYIYIMSISTQRDSKISGNIFDLRILRQMIHFIRPYRLQFWVVVLLMCLLSLLVPLRPYLIQYTLDTSLAEGRKKEVLDMTILLIGLLCTQAVVQYFYLYYAGQLGQRVVCDIRTKLYTHVQRLSLQFFSKTPIGRLVTRCVSDIETLLDVFSQGLASILGDLLQLVVLSVLMFVVDWRLALVSLSTLPLLLLSTYVFKEKIKQAFNQVRVAVAKLNTFVQEHITGMHIVQVFGVEKRTFGRFEKINTAHRYAHMQSVLYYSIYFPIAEIIQALSIGLLVWYGAGRAVQEEITLGMLIAYILYINLFFRPIRMIADKFNTLQLGIVSAHRVFALLREQSQISDTGTLTTDKLRGELAFENVCFAYEAPNYVLQNISFVVREGQMVALVGETGSGKTSTIHLINRLYLPQRGRITLDGKDIRQYQLSLLRQQVGFVLQDVFLFSDTVRHNITLYDRRISDTQIRSTAEKIGAWSFIEQLPEGLEHKVMERGASLSVGERQLISFLRAMVYDPKVLVLDEATSSVDNETEVLLQRATFELMKGRATLVVAHRLSTIQHADKIIVLSEGKIVEEGTHAELLTIDGHYHRLYEMQYKSQAQES